ncbi:MAG: InlB B-repeat-containing protein [Ruminococcus sp.]|nr:InlB B-repeat-containing protein [Candidatus Copronaster equi]
MKKLISCLMTIVMVLCMFSCLSVTSLAASSYYFDSENGNDGVWSNSASKPYKSLDKLNSKSFSSGSTVYIKRGSVYRGQLITQAGVTYTAYGEGNAPLFLGSDDAHDTNWQTTSYTNVWVYNKSISNDIGNIIFNDGECWGYKQVVGVNDFTGSLAELDTDLEFYHNTDGKVYLYSKTNPYTRFNSIELAKKVTSSSNSDVQHLIVLKDNVTLDGLCLKYSGNHGVHGNNVKNVTVKNCEFGWIGGSIQSGTTRYGNAIEFWSNCDNIKILNNHIYQIYDTGITFQCTDAKTFSNFTVTGNTVDYCTFSFEYFLPAGGSFKNIDVSSNIFNYAGYGWGDQRSDNEYAGHINSWFLYANPSTDFVISNNTFNGSTENLFITGSNTQNTVRLSGNKYNQCDLGEDNWANHQLLTWYNGQKYQFNTTESAILMNTLDSTAQFGYCPLPYDSAKITELKEAVFGVAEPTEANLAHLYQGTNYNTLCTLMGIGDNLGIIDFYNAIKEKRSANWNYISEFINQNENAIKSAAASAITVTAVDKDIKTTLKYAQGDKYDNAVTKLPTNAFPGSTVTDWSVSGGTVINGNSTVLTSSHTINANRKGNTYSVSFDANGGEISSTGSTSVSYGAEYKNLPEGSCEKGVADSWAVKTNPTASTKIMSDAGYGRVGDIGVPAYFDITARNCDYVSKTSMHYAPKPQYTPVMVMDNADAPEIYLIASKGVYSNLSELPFNFYIDGSRLNYHNLQVTHCDTSNARFSLSGCGDFIEGTSPTAMNSTLNPVTYKLCGNIPDESCSFYVSIGVTSYHPTWDDSASELGIKSFTAFVKFKINIVVTDNVENGDTVQAFSEHTLVANWGAGYDIFFNNEFNFDEYNWDGVWSAEREVNYIENSYTLKNLTGDAQNNTYNGDYCGGNVRGIMRLIPGHTYRVSYKYKNNTALDGVKGNVRLFGFETAQCTGGMYTISPLDGSNPTWTASANENGTYSYEVKIPDKNYFVSVRCNAFNCNGASVTFSDIYICDITNNLPLPQEHKKIVKKGGLAGTLPLLTAEKYNFLGWFTDRDSDGNGTGTEIKSNSIISTDTKIFSKWELKSFTVSVNPDGGACRGVAYSKAEAGKITAQKITDSTIENSTDIKIEASTKLVLPAPAKDGYIFVGWKCDNSILPQNNDGKTEVTVSVDKTINAVWEKEEAFVYGLYAGITPSEFIEMNIDTEKYAVSYNTPKVGTDTVFTVTEKGTGKLVKKYIIVIFGDVNGDGWYDGTDAVVVNLIANGMLTKEQVGEAVYMAADCNHDGAIDTNDVKLLKNAGILLDEIGQTDEPTLSASSVYTEYLNMIDQNVEDSTDEQPKPVEENNFISSIISFIYDIVAFVKTLIAFINNGMPGLPFGK